MTSTWKFDLLELLEQASKGKTTRLNKFIQTFSPFAAVNNEYTALVVLRHFDVNYWEGKRNVFNSPPEKKDFQWGITIATRNEDGGMESNVYVPNTLNYTGIKIQGNEVEILTGKNTSTKTNITELYRKLEFWDDFTEKDIEKGFKALCNEDYNTQKTSKPRVKQTSIQIPSLGTLVYHEKNERYEGSLKTRSHAFKITLEHCTPKKLEKLMGFVNVQMSKKFYDNILLNMETYMLPLKNEDWLEPEEKPITAREFRKRISITNIDFYSDGSSAIYCNDGDIFWGHLIQISIDKNGKYQNADIVG
jgi:hypothetical protein